MADAKPNIHIPPGRTVTVRLIDVASFGPGVFDRLMSPSIPGLRNFPALGSLAFLIEHPSGRRLLFDLGVRKDWENLSPETVKLVKSRNYDIKTPKHVIEILAEEGIQGSNIEGIIWSHAHWDHLGDPSLFPKSTALIIGPGFEKKYFPGSPRKPDSCILESDYADRPVRSISFEPTSPQSLQIGSFPAHDYFGDGSFYLLDAPGHMQGHMCGLVRTTSPPDLATATDDEFVLMAADTAHHGAELRPSPYLPFPPSILESLRASYSEMQLSRGMDPAGPAFVPALGEDLSEAKRTVDGLMLLDADERVLTVMAHDRFVKDEVDVFPKVMNGWKEKGCRERLLWRFLEDLKLPT